MRQEQIGSSADRESRQMRIAVFAGTYEGRLLAERLDQYSGRCPERYQVFYFVATAYGEQALSRLAHGTVLRGRKDAAQMEACFRSLHITLVIDATHPFAREASANIRKAAQTGGCRYERLVREKICWEDHLPPGQCTVTADVLQAAAYLSTHPGRALVTTGSKEAACYKAIPDFTERIFLRVLPGEEIKRALLKQGFLPEQILQAAGPFSREENRRFLLQIQADYLVTKDSGAHSGTAEKLQAAADCGVRVILIARKQETGLSFEQIWQTVFRIIDGADRQRHQAADGERV